MGSYGGDYIIRKIILLSGRAEAGKNTMADLIADHLDNTVNIAYADRLKDVCIRYFNWDGNKDEKGRTLLQRIGTDVVRNKIPYFWVREVAQLIEVFEDEFDCITISDVRFPNEIQYMKNLFGDKVVTVKVIRDNYVSSLTEEQKNHPSETSLDNYIFDYYINNDSDLFNLNIKVKTLLKRLGLI